MAAFLMVTTHRRNLKGIAMSNEATLDLIAQQELCDNGRSSFTFEEAAAWCIEYSIGNEARPSLVIQGLQKRGFTKTERISERSFRTIGSNPHDRWHGPGACRTHGGGGGSSINGIAGAEG